MAEQTRRFEALPLLIATTVAGAAGYITIVAAGVLLPAAGYSSFAVFWSALYLVISGLSGIQQEVARAVGPSSLPAMAAPPRVLRAFTAQAAPAVAIVCLVLFTIIAANALSSLSILFAAPLAIGTGAYVLLAALNGTAAGLSMWKVVALTAIVDAVLRLVLVGLCLLAGADVSLITWAIIAPLPISVVVAWLLCRSRIIGRFEVDVSLRQLWANAGRTVVGASAMGVLISGFPFLLGATSDGVDAALLAAIIFAINVARAPIVIVVLALQSYFIVLFQRSVQRRVIIALLAAVAAGTLLASAFSAIVGPAVLETVFPDSTRVEGWVLAVIVASGGLVGAMCITGPLAISQSAHAAFTAGWITAAVTTLVCIIAPFDFLDRVMVALVAGPLSGLVVHATALARRRGNQS